ncbi:retropepsin-like aspartic protease [Arcticibacter tournemirensis]|nr:retropepsin-like aspartic protease [Arcticibacter tournemirensis]
MKRLLLTLSLAFSFILTSNAQRNFVLSSNARRDYVRELVDLMQQGRCFDAREFREQYADKLPVNDKTLDALYKAHMSMFFNKPDSAAIYIEDLIANHELKIGPGISPYYGKLLSIYDSQQRFSDGVIVCDKYLDYLRRNPFFRDHDFIRNETNSIEKTKKTFKYRDLIEPRIKIERDNSGKGKTIRINDSELIRFNASYNGVTAETTFDTGFSAYFTITRSLADKLGTKLVNKNQDSVQMFNGVPRKMRVEVIDQVDFGGIRLHNIPVVVFNDPFTSRLSDTLNAKMKSSVEKIFNNDQVIMGLPAMKLVGRFDFDWEKQTVSFPVNNEKTGPDDSSNIFLIDNNPFVKLKINGLSWTGHLDVGSNDLLTIPFSFYNKNKKMIEIDSVTQKKPYEYQTLTSSGFNIPHELVKDANIYLNGRRINYAVGEVLVLDRNVHFNIFDGVAGVKLFKRLAPRISFDFDNMRVTALN